MASIVKRKSSFSVVYYYSDKNGARKQKWETYKSHEEALERKANLDGNFFGVG